MRFHRVALAFLLLGLPGSSGAQISPGELSAAHASLEGLSNCTSCHTLGKSVSNANCLTCHVELKKRIGAGTGLHSKYSQRQCIECHKEHHGRDFSLVRFDSRTFDHNTTGYALEGEHAAQQCKKCHARESIKAPDIIANATLMNAGTYLGLSRECLSCHTDTHRGQLSHECTGCHTYAGWKAAATFSHDRTRFHLTGKHAQVECAKCHPRGAEQGALMSFARMEFSQCSSCHRDPHAGRFVKPCDQCHTTAGWNQGPARSFDHSLTRFPLHGKHASLRCEQCHVGGKDGKGPEASGGFHITKFSFCNDCHADPHNGQFTKNPATSTCESCHTEAGWKEGKARTFDHQMTKFPLHGKHATVACARCHGSGKAIQPSRTAGIIDIAKFARCSDCHTNPHGAQFARRSDGGACEACHSEQGFSPSTFTAAEHEKTRFALVGSHLAIPCVKCHPPFSQQTPGSVVFAWNKEIRCGECHKDIHLAQFTGVTTAECVTCHSPDGWKTMIFRHEQTTFALTGKHVGLSCALCHGPGAQQPQSDSTTWRFKGTPSRCIDCHGESQLQHMK